MSACAGCGASLEPSRGNRPRKWCSDRCRKLTLYAKRCADCDALINTDGSVTQASTRCNTCNGAHSRKMSRRWIVESFAEWHKRFGTPPRATDWNPQLARAKGQVWRAERLAATGRPWPHVALVQDNFGSWNAGKEAAGLDTFDAGRYGRDGENPEVVAETVRLYRSGLSLAQVADHLDMSAQGVRERLIAADEPRRPPGRPAGQLEAA